MEKEKSFIVGSPADAAPGTETAENEVSKLSQAVEGAVVAPELPVDLPAAYTKLLAEKQALYDRLLRKQAELENLRKRHHREREEFLEHAAQELVRSLLPTLDGFESALKQRDPNVSDPFIQGIELIYRHLKDALARAGLTPIESVGKTFDPHIHQAVETVEAPGHREQEIVEELQRGYHFRRRLLRPATVKVAVRSKNRDAGPSAEEAGGEDSDSSLSIKHNN